MSEVGMAEKKSFAEEDDFEASSTLSGTIGLWHINIPTRVVAYRLNRAVSVRPANDNILKV